MARHGSQCSQRYQNQSGHPDQSMSQMLSRLPYSGRIINSHISFEYERSQGFHGREHCTSCGTQFIRLRKIESHAVPGHGIAGPAFWFSAVIHVGKVLPKRIHSTEFYRIACHFSQGTKKWYTGSDYGLVLQQPFYCDMIIYRSYFINHEFPNETRVGKAVFHVVSSDWGEV